MRRRLLASVALTALLCLAAAANLPEKWRSWHYSRGIRGNPSNSTGAIPAAFRLPWDIFKHCSAGCADLRIVDEASSEVPFVYLGRSSSRPVSVDRAAHIVENSHVANQYTQVVGDLGANGSFSFDRVTVQTNRTDFLVWAEVALSDDAKTWRVVEARAPIARFRARSIEGTQTIAIHGLSSRYVRVRIADPSAKFPVEGLTVSNQVEHAVQSAAVPLTVSEAPSASPGESAYQATLDGPNQPNSELRLQTDSPEFYRGVRISGSNDGREWSYFGSGFVYRYKQGDTSRELLTIEYPENSGYGMLRVEIMNGDDQPLQDVKLIFGAFPRTVAFKYSSEKRYRLLYGNDKAGHGQYDLANYFQISADAPSYLIVSLQPEELTANYRDPRPFTERHPEVLWLSLGAAILLIGLTAIKTLRTTAPPAGQS